MVDFNNFNIQWFVGVGFMVLLLAVAHWFPWSWFNGKKLPRLAAYVLGGMCLLVGLTIYLNSINQRVILPVIDIFVIAGLAVFLFYGIDWMAINFTKVRRDNRHRQKEDTGE